MGLVASYQKEAISRTYRSLTKDQLTMMIYGICKNIMAKWCYPFKNPDEVSQKEINQFLDIADFHIKKIRVIYPNLKKTYDIPYDVYLRGIYRYAESLETKLGTNMDKVFFEKVIGSLYGDNAACISKLDINKTDSGEYTFVFNKNISSNLKDGNIDNLAKAILSVYSKCRFGAIIVSSYAEKTGHRTLLFIENINDVLNIFYYDPHGSNKLSWSNQQNIYNKLYELFNIFVKPVASSAGIKDLIVNKYETICLLGIQALSAGYDIGMCQIFTSLWLYSVVKVIAESTKNNIALPPTKEWLYLIDDYFISQFDRKQRYNTILLFVAKLFNFYIRNNATYLSELSSYNDFLLERQEITSFEVPYDSKSKEDIKESEEYIVKIARKGIFEARKDEEEKQRQSGFIAESLLPPKRHSTRVLKRHRKQGGGFIAASLLVQDEEKSKAAKRKAQEETEIEEESYEQYSKKVKTQQQKEQEYSKSLRGRIPFMSKKKLFEDCLYDSDCISGCCRWSDTEKIRYCNESDACPKI
jgi:hypothetical protein